MPTTLRFLCPCLLSLALLTGAAAQAQSVYPPPSNVLALSASASGEVPQDMLTVTLSAMREGSDAATVQAQLKQVLDAALTEARKTARPGQLEVRTGGFGLSPRWVQGRTSGWQGAAQLIIEGRDIAAVSTLAGRLPGMSVAGAGFSLSREAREQAEAELSAQAIARYRALADNYAKQFGFAGWTLREVQVNSQGDYPMIRSIPMSLQVSKTVAPDAPLPVEPGKATVTVGVSGSVQMSVK